MIFNALTNILVKLLSARSLSAAVMPLIICEESILRESSFLLNILRSFELIFCEKQMLKKKENTKVDVFNRKPDYKSNKKIDIAPLFKEKEGILKYAI